MPSPHSSRADRGAAGARRPPGGRVGRVLRPSNLLTDLVLIFPLFLAYQIGILFTHDVQNGADFVTRVLFSALRGDRSRYLVVNLVLGASYLGLLAWLRRRQRVRLRDLAPLVAEAAVYALTMGTLIVFVMTRLLHVDPRLALGPLDSIVLSLGAGVHEELIFRVVIFSGLAAGLEGVLGVRRWAALAGALLASAALFSLAHHLGPLGEPLRLGVFTYRLLAGVFFGVLYRTRGLAVAVYTHALYDLYVFLIG